MHTKAFAVLTILIALAAWGMAGPLTPPAGPVASTMKTLDEVEARIPVNSVNTPGSGSAIFRITAPGSYYLTGNLNGESGKHGIDIAVSGVTLDLNGYTMAGVPGSLAGIQMTAFQTNTVIRNGHIRFWGRAGIKAAIDSGVIEGIHASNNAEGGIINAGGFSCAVRNCSAFNNGTGTTGSGFEFSSNATIESCQAYSNQGDGFVLGDNVTVTNCTSGLNTGRGFTTASPTVFTACTASSNGGFGFDVTESIVVDCISTGNAKGFSIGDRTLMRSCVASLNGQEGIVGGFQVSILNCQLRSIGGGVGILITGNDCRLEGNNLALGAVGIRVTGSGNILIGNSCSGHTTANYDIAANNRALAVNAPAAAAFTGSTGGTALTTDPNANFSY